MSFGFVFEALKAHLRTRGMTYKDLAVELKVSEATVKRVFSERDCTLRRLEQICEVLQVDLQGISRGAPRQTRLVTQLTRQQEQEIVDDIRLLIVAVCAMSNVKSEEIVSIYDISEPQCIGLLARLDKIGFLELMPNNRYRLLVARTFRWIPDGPIMRWVKLHALDYFDHIFNGPGETLRVINVRLSGEARAALLARLEQLALEYEEQHSADARLPLDQRFPLSLCLAVRPWEPKPFRSLRRPRAAAGPRGGHHT
jgi:DNA-binding Xre family transcriptional regulator